MELFFSTILIIISFDHIFPHGYQLFFIENRDIITKNLGIYLFLVQFCGSLFNIISIICLFWGIKKSKAFYLIPHIIWQIFYIGTSLLLTTCVMYLVMRRTMLRGSAEMIREKKHSFSLIKFNSPLCIFII
uniref:7TM_GPCR_Srx domain-containing protein n=1 Tax=Parastrongyloides trichosuri TaxID=131310 RepID=A0A0N4Z4L6_PARTI